MVTATRQRGLLSLENVVVYLNGITHRFLARVGLAQGERMAPKILLKMDGLARAIPILRWLPHYEAGWFRADVIAGLTLVGDPGS
jgi:hypothetical protein